MGDFVACPASLTHTQHETNDWRISTLPQIYSIWEKTNGTYIWSGMSVYYLLIPGRPRKTMCPTFKIRLEINKININGLLSNSVYKLNKYTISFTCAI